MSKKKLFDSKEDFIVQYRQAIRSRYGETFDECTLQERYYALARFLMHKAHHIEGDEEENARKKRVYYFSLEFLLGPLLDNYLINFGIRDLVAEGIAQMGGNLEEICAQEQDPGLGNGGLGRLAACFLDSMAHEGMLGCGNGMRYRYGLFRQEIKDGRQVERTDDWLKNGFPWESRKPDSAVVVRFNAHVVRHEGADGSFWFTQEGGDPVLAVPYDVPIVGFGGTTVNKLRLWSAEPYVENFDLDAFNAGDYAKANKFRSDVEAISTILYPNDAGEHGRLLRLKQEYLFVSAGLQTILRTFEREHGQDWEHLADFVALHTNDTHPALCGPELMRILVDEKRVSFDEAFKIARAAISFTNHTVMPEALETWPIDTFRHLLPRVYMIIDEIDRRFRDEMSTSVAMQGGIWADQLRNMAILWDGKIRMANLSIIFSHSVNGVSALHTQILKDALFKDFYQMRPDLFNNKTDGVSHRRFLAEANPPFARLITDAIGEAWLADADELEKLAAYEQDFAFLDEMERAKLANKERLAVYIKKTTGITVDPASVFDVQVKRFHAYKRQLLNVFKILDLRNRILADPGLDMPPVTFIFSGKAAQSYVFAKEVIRLINSVADVVNADPVVSEKIKVVFIPNFAVSNAQLIYSAAEISEQISVAGSEASGTSNMKLMMNAAITLGTYDGSNIEISELVGPDNIKIFGLRADEVERLRRESRYYSWDVYHNDRARRGRIIDQLTDGTFACLSGNFESIHDYLMISNDPDLVLCDFNSYVDAFEDLLRLYRDRRKWNAAALHNTAKAGYFSSDRTIREYMTEIWHL